MDGRSANNKKSIHEDENYECLTCNKTFTCKRNLQVHYQSNSHILKSQNPEYVPTTLDLSYTTCICGKKYQVRCYKAHITTNNHKQAVKLLEMEKKYLDAVSLQKK